MAPQYKIFGERCSGTNLLRALLEGHIDLAKDDVSTTGVPALDGCLLAFGRIFPKPFDALHDVLTIKKHKVIFGWKHSTPDIALLQQQNITPIIITKHPAYWARSFKKTPFHFHHPGKYIPRRIENMEQRPIEIEDLILYKMRAYRSTLEECGGIHVQYETLVHYFCECRANMVAFFGGCEYLPNEDVRPFAQRKAISYIKEYPLELPSALSACFSRQKLAANSSLLSAFGYTPSECKKTVPSLW